MNECRTRIKPCGLISVTVNPIDKEVVNKRLDIDPFGTSKKLLNPCGFPMNDIMAFENAQSESVARTILQRINVIKDTGLTNDGRTIDEHFEDLCPANWSSPAEYVRYQQKLATNYYNRVKAKADAAKAAADAKAAAAIKDAQTKEINVNPE